MKKTLSIRTLAIAVAVLFAAAFASCSLKENYWENDGEQGEGFVLRFTCGDDFEVRSIVDSAGVASYNENRLDHVEFFIYPDGRTDEDAVFHGWLENVRPQTAYSIPMVQSEVDDIFPNNNKNCYIYAIANYTRIVAEPLPGDEIDLSGTSVDNLENLTHTFYQTGSVVDTIQTNFPMATDGPFKATLISKRATTVSSPTVPLKRLAAKLSVLVRVAPSTTVDNTVKIGEVTKTRTETWVSIPEQMTIYLVNGAKTAKLSGKPADNLNRFNYGDYKFRPESAEQHQYTWYEQLFDNEQVPPVPLVDGEGNYKYDVHTDNGDFLPCRHPFYTYPQKWTYGTDEEPYLKLTIPWVRQRDTEQGITQFQKVYYYRVYCPASPGDRVTYDAEFLRNHWYKVILNVSILGSETDGGEITLDGSYYVFDWQEKDTGNPDDPEASSGINDSDKDAEIKGARYLYVNKDTLYMYNVNTLTIPYITTDPCEIVDFEASRMVFTGSSAQKETITNPSTWNIDASLVTTSTGAHIAFEHILNNDMSTSDYDVSAYEITFTLRQKTNHEYSKVIKIYQYPAIMISMDPNLDESHNGYVFLNNNYSSTGTTGANTYVKLPNGYTNSSYGIGSNGTSSGNNTNFNMFIVETTVLPVDSKYVLGDPRTATIDNLNPTNWPTSRTTAVATWSANTSSIQNTTRRLSYYYPVNDSQDADDIIAPKVRIASSHGATLTVTYANAFRRCASYQEKGYPAGRWRLPTVAEIKYISQLNTDGKIDRLFGGGSTSTDYWCNSGYVRVYLSGTSPQEYNTINTNDQKSVRCVYDEWYWSGMKYGLTDVTTVDQGSFKWGDMAR